MNKLATALLAVSIGFGSMASAGGLSPVVVETPVIEEQPTSSLSPLVLLGILVVVGVLISQNDEPEEEVVVVVPPRPRGEL